MDVVKILIYKKKKKIENVCNERHQTVDMSKWITLENNNLFIINIFSLCGL